MSFRVRSADFILFDRITLENHMIRTCGSKMEWVRHLTKKETRKQKLRATLQRKEEETDAFLEELAPGFAAYVGAIGFRNTDNKVLEQCSQRFVTLMPALEQRGLSLRHDSRFCQDFITMGDGDISSIVDTVEEMNFLFTHTNYQERWDTKIDNMRDDDFEEYHVWYPKNIYRDMMQDCRDEAKMEVHTEYLKNDRGLTLPRKWGKLRPRSDK